MALVAGLFFTGGSTCCAQDKYLRVTSDSSLAFKLALSDFPVTAPPVYSEYNPCDIPVMLGGVGMGVGAGFVMFGLFGGSGITGGSEQNVINTLVGGVLFISGTFVLLSGLVCYIIRKHKHGTR